MPNARRRIVGVLVVAVLLIVPSLANGQARNFSVGAEAEYLGLIGHWRSPLESGFGAGVFVAFRGVTEVRLGATVSFHFEEFGVITSAPSAEPPGETRRIERYYGELRLIPYRGPAPVLVSFGLRAGILHAPSIATPWSWQLEVPVGVTLQKGPMPELYLAGGLVIFPEENLRRPRTANTVRVGLSVRPFGS
jgi:hypothetical protein